jgi:hypothetical protein
MDEICRKNFIETNPTPTKTGIVPFNGQLFHGAERVVSAYEKGFSAI